MFKLFKNCKMLAEDFTIKKAQILIRDGIIYEIYDESASVDKPLDCSVNLDGMIIFPGMINSHDHLIETSWKELGKAPVNSWKEWYDSVHQSADYKLMQRLSVADLYTLGMYKNTISGVTTVVDHFPPEVSDTFTGHHMISLLDHIYVAHSASDNRLEWCGDLQEQHKRAGDILPFIIHVREGSTEELNDELENLNRIGVLTHNTVLVNGVYLDDNDFQAIKSKQASLVWLPEACAKLYGRQPNIKRMLEMGIPIAIGTDSSDTGSKTMTESFKTALAYSSEYCNNSITPKSLVEMSTIAAAKIFGMEKHIGSLTLGKKADFVVFEEIPGEDPFKTFVSLKPEDLVMVVHEGCMVYGESEFRKVSTLDISKFSEVRVNGVSKLLYGRPMQLLERVRNKLEKDVVYPFFNIETDE